MSQERKAVVRRLGALTAVVLLSLAGLSIALVANVVARRAYVHRVQLNEQGGELMLLIAQIRLECRFAPAEQGETDMGVMRARVAELWQEADESGKQLAPTVRSIGLAADAQQLEHELAELAAAAQQWRAPAAAPQRMADLVQKAETLERLVPAIVAEAGAWVDGAEQHGRRLMAAAAVCFLAVLVMAVLGGLLMASDAIDELLGVPDLDKELKVIQDTEQFKHRIQWLSSRPEGGPQAGDWQLSVGSIVRHTRTHTVFEALAERGGERIRLWGKCYRWAGFVKGLQRLIAPAYGRATWHALLRMHNHGLNPPLPVAAGGVRRGPARVGMIVLAEHIGATQSVKEFIQTRFLDMDEQARAAFLRQMVDFWNATHACGLVSLSPRYLECVVDKAGGPARFYLFDLDKVHVGRPGAGLWQRLGSARDNRRLKSWLENNVTLSEMRLVEERIA